LAIRPGHAAAIAAPRRVWRDNSVIGVYRTVNQWWTQMASHSFFEIVVLLAAIALYFLPALIADKRRRVDLLTLALFNAVLGWTAIGWMIALLWAVQPNPPENLGEQTRERERRLEMGVFSRLLADRIAARAARSAKREHRPR